MLLVLIYVSLCALPFPEKGDVFVWGYGILGKGPNLSESSTPEKIPSTLFGRSEFNPSVAVAKIRCGLSHFAAITGKTVEMYTRRGKLYKRPGSCKLDLHFKSALHDEV